MKLKKYMIIICILALILNSVSTIVQASDNLINSISENKLETPQIDVEDNEEITDKKEDTDDVVEEKIEEKEDAKQEDIEKEEMEKKDVLQNNKTLQEIEKNPQELKTDNTEKQMIDTTDNTIMMMNLKKSPVIEDGVYTIASALNNNLVLDVFGAYKNNGANVQIGNYNGNKNQQFKVEYQSDGYYTIEALHSGKRLDVHGAGKQNGTNVEQFETHNGDNQKWTIEKTEDGYYSIISKCNGLYLDVYGGYARNGTNIQMFQKNNTLGQKFVLISREELKSEKIIEDGIYKIGSALNNKLVLDVFGAYKNNGANVQISYKGNGKNQQFKIEYQSDGYYTIEAMHSGKRLDVHGAGKQNGTNVEQFEIHNGDNQKWIIQKTEDGYYSIISKCNGLYLDVFGGNASSGTNIQVFKKNNTLGQKFTFEEVDEGQEIEDGIYKIQTAINTNLVLDVAGKSKEDGANIQVNENGNGKNQRVNITYIGDGCYTIEAVHSKKRFDVHASGTENGTNVEQFEAHDGDNQKWIIQKTEDGYYSISSKCNGLYLEVADENAKKGTNIHVYEKNNSMRQKFIFRVIEEGQTIEDGTYKISTALNTNMVLDVSGASKANGANIAIWTRNNNNHQKFNVKYVGDGYYTIQSVNSGKMLDVKASGKQNGTNVEQFEANGADNQKWQIKDAGNDYYNIISKCNGLYLDIHGGYAQNGANVQMFEKNNKDNQKFSFDDQYYGIDVSKHQGNIDFKELSKTGIDFMIIRAGYGRDAKQEDIKFQYNYQQAKAYGIPVGVYWYSYAQTVEQAVLEAKNCLRSISGKSFELPIFFDIEDPSQAGIDKQTQTDMCIAFCETIKNAGFSKVGIYTGKYWLKEHIDIERIPEEYRLWIASYGTNNGEIQHKYAYTGRHEIWQYTSKGSISGINGDVDMNIAYQRFF